MSHNSVIIIGSGPAGLTAAIYTARAGYTPLVVGGFEFGGQLMLTTLVENFPGFPDGIMGPELMQKMRRQAEKVGAVILDQNASSVDLSSRPFKVYVDGETHTADAIIIATGASARWLGLESEAKLKGRGVSSCAVCDGAFFKGQDVVVVGGGDSAMEDSLYLSNICKSVTVVHRRDRLRASSIMQRRATSKQNIRFVWNSAVEEVQGESRVTGVKVRNLKTGALSDIPCQAMFVAIGHDPNTAIFRPYLETDEKGYLKVKNETRTGVEGVFGAGDVSDHVYRQAVTAAGVGSRAALDAVRYLEAYYASKEEAPLAESPRTS